MICLPLQLKSERILAQQTLDALTLILDEGDFRWHKIQPVSYFYTVGGTPNPIINAVNDHHSGGALKKVVIICSEPNPETGESGSDIQVSDILLL